MERTAIDANHGHSASCRIDETCDRRMVIEARSWRTIEHQRDAESVAQTLAQRAEMREGPLLASPPCQRRCEYEIAVGQVALGAAGRQWERADEMRRAGGSREFHVPIDDVRCMRDRLVRIEQPGGALARLRLVIAVEAVGARQ